MKPIAPLFVNQHRELHQPLRYREGQPAEYLCPDCRAWHPWAQKAFDPASAAYLCPDCAEGRNGGEEVACAS